MTTEPPFIEIEPDTTAPEMTDLTSFAEISSAMLEPAVSYAIDSDVIRTAVQHAIAAVEAQPIGEHGLAFVIPEGATLVTQDQRTLSDERLPTVRRHTQAFVGVRSLAAYVTRFKLDQTLGYIRDLTALGTDVLRAETKSAALYVLDDLPVDTTAAHRAHIATLTLRPTAAAIRWGRAIAADALDQEQMLDLIADGIGEIAEPDGAALHDLIADLHAIRSTDVKSVRRTGGQATIEVAENVSLHSGSQGSTVVIPEAITVVFPPFAALATKPVVLKVTVKPKVTSTNKVLFVLDAPGLADAISATVGEIAEQLTEGTGIEPLWIP